MRRRTERCGPDRARAGAGGDSPGIRTCHPAGLARELPPDLQQSSDGLELAEAEGESG
ncbi:hypothetical protein ABZX90_21165 [Streptomyces sp. NPDC002935]|uniref:hypothetical protein n=1 Tax=Streptomyces sp. NPDC002935 TaxID=3154545 RepID=UPI0033B27ED2